MLYLYSNMKENVKVTHKFSLKPNLWDLVVFVVSILVTVGLIIAVNVRSYQASLESGDKIANVYYNGQKIKEVNLSTLASEETFVMTNEDYPSVHESLVITFSPTKGVAITEAHCPDLICNKQGYIFDTSKAIVCLPSSVYIVITTASSGNEGWM